MTDFFVAKPLSNPPQDVTPVDPVTDTKLTIVRGQSINTSGIASLFNAKAIDLVTAQSGKVISITLHSDVDISGGSCSARLFIDGVQVDTDILAVATVNGSNQQRVLYPSADIEFTEGQRIEVRLQTTSCNPADNIFLASITLELQ